MFLGLFDTSQKNQWDAREAVHPELAKGGSQLVRRGLGRFPVASRVLGGVGGREGIRTPGLLVANEALSQLSYSPTSSNKILANVTSVANRRLNAVFQRRHHVTR